MTLLQPTERLIVALDYSTWAAAEKLVQLLPEVQFFKVGLELYLASKGQAVAELNKRGKKVFLDLKFHDIPHTVAQASRQAVEQGAALFNLHAGGGREMLQQGVQAAREKAAELGLPVPLVLAVTVLTSLAGPDLAELGLADLTETVRRYACLAREAGLGGVVASPREISLIRKHCGPDFKIVCPGIRPAWAATNDQQRIMTPQEAIALGADYLVIGRPITGAANPREAALRIMAEMEGEIY